MNPSRVLLGLVVFTGCACLSACSPAAPSPNQASVEIRPTTFATGSGQVSVYHPRFQPGAELIGTCIITSGSGTCTYSLGQRTGTIELIASAATGSTFGGWAAACASSTTNACVLTITGTNAMFAQVTFSMPMVRVRLAVTGATVQRGNATGVLRTSQGHTLQLPSTTQGIFWDFDVPQAGGDITLSVQPNPGSIVTYLGARLNLIQGNIVVCDNASGFATSCTFVLRPSEVLQSGSLLDIVVYLEEVTVPPPPPAATQRYVATTGRDGGNNCTVQTDPCLTMQYAMSVSVTNDVINIAAGTYTGRVDVSKAVTVKGASRASTFLRGQFLIGSVNNLSGTVAIEGFTLQRATESSAVLVGGMSAASNITLSQLAASGFDRGVDGVLSGGEFRITSSAFNDNFNDGIHVEGQGIITFTGLEVVGNDGDGIQFSSIGSGTISISGTRVQDSNEAGIQIEGMQSGTVSLSSSCVVANGKGPNGQAGVTLSFLGSVSFTANSNNIVGNLAGGVDVTMSSVRPNFRSNWWGSAAGPSGSNGATGNVDVSSPAGAPISGVCL